MTTTVSGAWRGRLAAGPGEANKTGMTQDRIAKGVVLPTGHTGSSLFHAVLAEAVAEYPQALGGARFPAAASVFKREYGAALARLEAARAASP
jgi:hypothetical protein